MDFNTFLTAAGSVSQDLGQTAGAVLDSLPQSLRDSLRHAASYIPAQVDVVTAAMFMLYFTAASLVLGCLGRVVLGRRSSLNRSLSATIGILFIYVVTVVVYTFKPWNLEALLSPLPFVTFTGEYLVIFPILGSKFPALCSELLSLIILAFLVNFMDAILPQGKHVITWYVLRLLMVASAMLLHLIVGWASRTFLPGFLVTYAPTILLFLLAFMMLSGLINLVLGLVITMANPFMGAMYTFFFSNMIGKQISKAVFSSLLICAVLFLLESFGYTILCISASALTAYLPMVIILLALWYLIGHVL